MRDPISTERRGATLEVTLDRPPANAIDGATSRRMSAVAADHALLWLPEDAREGPRAFAEKRAPVWRGR